MGRIALIARAVVLIALGATLVVLGLISPEQPAAPTPTTSWRPATELEQRERDRQLLEDEMRRAWEQRHPQSTATPPPAAGGGVAVSGSAS